MKPQHYRPHGTMDAENTVTFVVSMIIYHLLMKPFVLTIFLLRLGSQDFQKS